MQFEQCPNQDIHELTTLSRIIDRSQGLLRSKVLANVAFESRKKKLSLPLVAVEIGSQDRSAPTFGIFGGVHGLERIGAELVLAFLNSIVNQLEWDEAFRESFKNVRIVSIPMVNPGGAYLFHRANPRGVDLMRNAPQDAEVSVPWLAGGHRVSNQLPWFRGVKGAPMEIEAQALVNYVEDELFSAPFSIALDVHSGFGFRDRFWYPYAKRPGDFPAIDPTLRLKALLDRSLPNHIYQIENQSVSYSVHGDLWDYMFDRHHAQFASSKTFLPWTLEMGSWTWMRKNPLQALSRLGWFHPIQSHRKKRIMRRHQPLLEFLLRATREHSSWNQEKKFHNVSRTALEFSQGPSA